MKKSRAIELLEHLVWHRDIDRNPYVDALNMAIDALKAQLSQEGTTKDAISKQWLLECINEGWIKFDTDKDANRFIHLVRDIAPSVQPEPQWIPVSERLPETEEFVLASLTGKYRNITFEHSCEIADYADGEWCVYAYPHMSVEKCAELIEAWMPLPEPYKPNK